MCKKYLEKYRRLTTSLSILSICEIVTVKFKSRRGNLNVAMGP